MKLPCSIVREVLPNYIDECIGEEAKELIHEHLESCEECQKLYEEMKQPLAISDVKEFDYLKQVKRKNVRRVSIAVLITVLLFLFGIGIKTFAIGHTNDRIAIQDIKITQDSIHLNVKTQNRAESFVSYQITKTEDAIQELVLQTVTTSFLHNDNEMEVIIPLKDMKQYLRVGTQIIGKDGKLIDQAVSELVDHRIAYVGDAPAVSSLLKIMNFSQFGDYQLTLMTDKEPYGIKLYYKQDLNDLELEMLKQKAKAVLASIDNCHMLTIYTKGNQVTDVEQTEKINDYQQMQALLD